MCCASLDCAYPMKILRVFLSAHKAGKPLRASQDTTEPSCGTEISSTRQLISRNTSAYCYCVLKNLYPQIQDTQGGAPEGPGPLPPYGLHHKNTYIADTLNMVDRDPHAEALPSTHRVLHIVQPHAMPHAHISHPFLLFLFRPRYYKPCKPY